MKFLFFHMTFLCDCKILIFSTETYDCPGRPKLWPAMVPDKCHFLWQICLFLQRWYTAKGTAIYKFAFEKEEDSNVFTNSCNVFILISCCTHPANSTGLWCLFITINHVYRQKCHFYWITTYRGVTMTSHCRHISVCFSCHLYFEICISCHWYSNRFVQNCTQK